MWRRSALAAALVEAALSDLTARGFRLAQAVLDESAGPQAGRDLIRGGMPRVTELLYMERDTTAPLPPEPVGRGSPDPTQAQTGGLPPRASPARTWTGDRSTR